MIKQVKLSQRGYIFGLGAFRRYKEITGNDLSHFEECILKSDDIGPIESNYRWAVMLKCANDVYTNINGGDKLSVDEFTVLLDQAEQEESNILINQYFDSTFMGRPMREYYGIPKKDDNSKKKNSAQEKRTSKR